MKSLIKRSLAGAAVAAAGCATGIAPAAAAAGDPPRYILESVANPGAVLTALPYGPISLVPRGATPGQVWDLTQSEGGVNLVNSDSGQCLTASAPLFGAPVGGARCEDRFGQDWRQIDGGNDTVLFGTIPGCLNGGFDRIFTGDCSSPAARWRLIPA